MAMRKDEEERQTDSQTDRVSVGEGMQDGGNRGELFRIAHALIDYRSYFQVFLKLSWYKDPGYRDFHPKESFFFIFLISSGPYFRTCAFLCELSMGSLSSQTLPECGCCRYM